MARACAALWTPNAAKPSRMWPNAAGTDETDGFQSLRNAASVAVDHAGLVGAGRIRKGCSARDNHSIPRHTHRSTRVNKGNKGQAATQPDGRRRWRAGARWHRMLA